MARQVFSRGLARADCPRVDWDQPIERTLRLDGRIDDPNAGWKGRGLWSMNGDRTPWLKEGGSTHIILAHDHNRLFDVTTALIDHMISKGFRFIDAVA